MTSIHITVRAALVAAALVAAAGLAPVSSPPAAAATTSGYSLSYSSGSNAVLRWNPCQRRITYRVNVRLAGASATARAAALADAKGAVSRVSAATGIAFRYLGTTSRVPTGATWWQKTGDAELVIAWVGQKDASTRSSLLLRNSSGFLAASGGWQSWQWGSGRADTAIVRGYVVVNSADNRSFRSGFGSGVTRGEMLLHELGHVMGLNHVGASSQIMYPTLISRARASYAIGDRAGLTRVGRAAGCIAIPPAAGAPADLS